MKPSNNLIAMIKKFEGFYSKAYWDVDGYSIGYGHHENVSKNDTITEAEASALLLKDLTNIYAPYVNNYVKTYNFNQNEFDALVDFTYNCGAGNLNRLLENGNNDRAGIRRDIVKYNKAGGVYMQGLQNRRNAELTLFNTPADTKQTSTVTGDAVAIAIDVIDGKYGTGQTRKNKLGARYNEIQAIVNTIIKNGLINVAKDVINGKYGNGETRKKKLGSNYDIVQKIVNIYCK